MLIEGTDGYRNTNRVCRAGDSSCSLNVPSAAEGVIDVVTATVNGGPTRQIVLVF